MAMGILDVPGVGRSTVAAVNLAAQTSAARGSLYAASAAPTVSLNDASQISGARQFNAVSSLVINTTDFAYFGCEPHVAGPQSPKAGGVIGSNLTSQSGSAGVGVANEVDTRRIEYPIRCNGQAIRIKLDGQVILDCAASRAAGTAQGASANSITLAASDAEAVNGGYNTAYIFITGGPGSGQMRTITGYNATTKAAVVSEPWAVQPDATSTYRISHFTAPFSIPNDNVQRFITIDLGVRGEHVVEFESTSYFIGIYVDSGGSVNRAPLRFAARYFHVGDSFGEGAGAAYSHYNGYGGYLAARNGWELFHLSAGGTGILATNAGARFNYMNRILPPANAWLLKNFWATAGGTYTLTQSGVTTAPIAWNANASAVQAALNSAFGAGKYLTTQHSLLGVVIIGLGPIAGVAEPMTVAPAGVTGAITCERYLGDIEPSVPRDENGAALPFVILLQGSLNDDSQAGLQAAAESLYAAVCDKWPTAIVIATGRQMNNGPVNATGRATNSALEAASTRLRKVNGKTPFANLFRSSDGVGYINGFTTVATASGASGVNSEFYVFRDQTHYIIPGYRRLAQVAGEAVDRFLYAVRV